MRSGDARNLRALRETAAGRAFSKPSPFFLK
nr:MAG TPA: hypothetical protein [Caudoviricetes sp.]